MSLEQFIPLFRYTNRPGWGRLLPRSREADLQRAVGMPIADPLWLLGRQWQFGEFTGSDGGAPVGVEVQHQTAYFDQYRADGQAPIDYTGAVPLESLVEWTPPPLTIRMRVRIGQQLVQFLKANANAIELDPFLAKLFDRLKLQIENLPEDTQSRRFIELVNGTCLDGQHLQDPERRQAVEQQLSEAERAVWDGALTQLEQWYQKLYQPAEIPAQTNSWSPSQLHYRFQLQANSTEQKPVSLQAPDYDSGSLDWHSFDSLEGPAEPQGRTTTSQLVPTNLGFAGMPHKRLFAFEDHAVDFGQLAVETRDLSRLMLMEYAFAYGNDWFLIPLDISVGGVHWINSLVVVDGFGVTTPIEPAKGPVLRSEAAFSWDVFKVRNEHIHQFRAAEHALVVPPLVAYREESKPLEVVRFARDEYANLVWGIEETLLNAAGQPVKGATAKSGRNVQAVAPFREHPVYRLSSAVPEHWIPYRPQALGLGETQLVRAAMQRNEDDAEPTLLPPRTQLNQEIQFLREEAIPRAGIRVQLTRQRCRWWNGRTVLWYGRKVVAGKGEENSGLVFDQVK